MSEDVKRFDDETLGFLLQEKKRLVALRPQIIAEDDADNLDELDGTIEQLTAAITEISMAHFARQEAREKYEKWHGILPACRQATEHFEKVTKDFERSKLQLVTLRSLVDNAFDKMQQVRDQRPRPERFPTDEEIELHNKREAKAEENHRAHVARLKAGNEKMHELYRDQWQAKLALDQLLFQERQQRPRDAQPADTEHIAGLAGVR